MIYISKAWNKVAQALVHNFDILTMMHNEAYIGSTGNQFMGHTYVRIPHLKITAYLVWMQLTKLHLVSSYIGAKSEQAFIEGKKTLLDTRCTQTYVGLSLR